jgi:hypothetical protein
MPDVQAQAPRYPVQVLTTTFHIQGMIEPIGTIINYLNDANRQQIQFLDATVSPLTPGPMGKIVRSQLVVPQADIVAMYVDSTEARSLIQLLKRIERCIAYMPSLVCRAEFHLGADTRWQDMFGLMVGDLVAVTAATVFPLIALPGPFPQQADLLILNRLHVQMLHLDQP